mmetsp:Transcript_9050/g.21672  ORF Transcript_9050/g.21672 Transcript_9050/m.21672 type:complete len:218 (-) Transcript_9050:20-673(-)
MPATLIDTTVQQSRSSSGPRSSSTLTFTDRVVDGGASPSKRGSRSFGVSVGAGCFLSFFALGSSASSSFHHLAKYSGANSNSNSAATSVESCSNGSRLNSALPMTAFSTAASRRLITKRLPTMSLYRSWLCSLMILSLVNSQPPGSDDAPVRNSLQNPVKPTSVCSSRGKFLTPSDAMVMTAFPGPGSSSSAGPSCKISAACVSFFLGAISSQSALV